MCQKRALSEYWPPYWKKRPHSLTQGGDFCRQPDFDSYMYKVSKNSGLQKSPGGAGFRLWAHGLYGRLNNSV